MTLYCDDLFADEAPYKLEPANNSDDIEKELSQMCATQKVLEAQYNEIVDKLKKCNSQIEILRNKLNKEDKAKAAQDLEPDLFS